MDYLSLITNVGFPIGCCFVMAKFIVSYMKEMADQLNLISDRHQEEIYNLKECIINNTNAIEMLRREVEKSESRKILYNEEAEN